MRSSVAKCYADLVWAHSCNLVLGSKVGSQVTDNRWVDMLAMVWWVGKVQSSLIRFFPVLHVVCMMCLAQVKLQNFLHFILHSIVGGSYAFSWSVVMCLCLRACFHVSTHVKLLSHHIFCLVSLSSCCVMWITLSTVTISQAKHTQVFFVCFLFWTPRLVSFSELGHMEHNAKNTHSLHKKLK